MQLLVESCIIYIYTLVWNKSVHIGKWSWLVIPSPKFKYCFHNIIHPEHTNTTKPSQFGLSPCHRPAAYMKWPTGIRRSGKLNGTTPKKRNLLNKISSTNTKNCSFFLRDYLSTTSTFKFSNNYPAHSLTNLLAWHEATREHGFPPLRSSLQTLQTVGDLALDSAWW